VIRAINQRIPVEVQAFDMKFTAEMPTNLPRTGYPHVSIARLFVGKLVKEDYILYVDADTICGRDFTEEIGGYLNHSKLMHAVRDIGSDVPAMRKYFRKWGIDGSYYVNSGVLFMRNGKCLDEMLMKSMKWIRDHANWSEYRDQDALYFVFGKENIQLIPKDFNCFFCKRYRLTDVVFHHGKIIRVIGQIQDELDRLVNCTMNAEKCAGINDDLVRKLRDSATVVA
jgi:lipopolysaccharide biosynthesis glycosyltransferase